MTRRRLLPLRIIVATAMLAAGLAAPSVRAAEAQVAVAANFARTLQQLAAGYTAATGHAIKVSAGPTGRLHSQIVAGAPFDVLLAADDETPRRLVASGHAVAGTAFTYAVGRLVLWSARPGYVDDAGAVLASGTFRHLAIANPKLAPYGAAAIDVLKARGLADALAPRLVTGESVAQAWQFVATGHAELGFVALAQLVAPAAAGAARPAPPGSQWLVPESLHRPIRQDAVLLARGAGNPAATALLDYLRSDAARRVLRAHGYGGG